MKRFLLVVGLILLIGVFYYFYIYVPSKREKGKSNESVNEISQSGLTENNESTETDSSTTIHTETVQSSRCPCLTSDEVKEGLESYKNANIMVRPTIRQMILQDCPCVPNEYFSIH